MSNWRTLSPSGRLRVLHLKRILERSYKRHDDPDSYALTEDDREKIRREIQRIEEGQEI